MSVEGAIFDERRGALTYYPSDLIATSMRILIEASKKGLKIAAVSLMSRSIPYVDLISACKRFPDSVVKRLASPRETVPSALAPLITSSKADVVGVGVADGFEVEVADWVGFGVGVGVDFGAAHAARITPATSTNDNVANNRL